LTTDLCLLGLLLGIGLTIVTAGLLPRRRSLASDIAAYDPVRILDAATAEPNEAVHPLTALGRRLDSVAHHNVGTRRDQDLAVTNRSYERHSVTTAIAALSGLAVPIVLLMLAAASGWVADTSAAVAFCALGLVAGAVGPRLELRRAAAQARSQWLHAFTCWLELVALAQAGGMGVEGALEAASRISPDETFSRIGQSLQRSRHSAAPPWDEIGRLGHELGIEELGELAASLGLAGIEGARIRTSLQAKSASLRRRQMAEALSRANSTTERLFLPSIVLMLGFMVFLMYPAGVSLSHVL
jgi:tight adherence protein C